MAKMSALTTMVVAVSTVWTLMTVTSASARKVIDSSTQDSTAQVSLRIGDNLIEVNCDL